jgi:WD40-like Beta Propeller Repeat
VEAVTMRLPRAPLATCLGVILAAAACDDPIEPPHPGAIRVVVAPSGEDVSTNGLQLNIENGTARQFALGGMPELTIPGLTPGAHTLRLHGMAVNCAVAGQNPRSVTVVSDDTTMAQFILLCEARVGSVRVTTATTGSDLDPDGYTVVVVDGQTRAISVNGSATMTNVREGLRLVTLAGVSPNCAITGPDTISVAVTLGGTADVAFALECVLSGNLAVAVATTGVDLDPDGYRVAVQSRTVGFTGELDIAANGSASLPRLRPADDYNVTLQGMAENCAVVGATLQVVAVTPGATTNITYTVSCGPPRLLAIVRDGDIYSIKSNGSGVTRLTTDPTTDGEPAWSATGRIAFTTLRHGNDDELYVMNEDGTNQVRITTSAGADASPSWSPNGQKIVFQSFRDVNAEIYVINADGSGLIRLTNTAASEFQPAWSSAGQIAFVSDRDHPAGEIYVMNDDGSNVVRLTHNELLDRSPAWSPDGSMIAFAREVECYYYYGCTHDIFVMNGDGSNQRRLATGVSTYQQHTGPSWAPNGAAIAFTRVHCYYYACNAPEVWLVDVQGPGLRAVADNAADPAWKP